MRLVEMNRGLDDADLRRAVAEPLGAKADSPEVAEAIELSVMVRVFHNLEGAGALPRGVTMATRLSDAQKQRIRAVMDGSDRLRNLDTPTTYEAALRVLVTDHDGDRKLDIDVEHLAASGLLRGHFEAAALEEILQRNPQTPIDHQGLRGKGDTFFQRQIDGETLFSTNWGSKANITYNLSDTSRAVQAGLRRTTLEGREAREFSAALARVTSDLRGDAARGVRAGMELARQVLDRSPRRAHQVITRLLHETAEPSAARDALIAELRTLEGGGFNLLVGEGDSGNRYYRMLAADGSKMRGRPPEGDIAMRIDGVEQTFDVSDFSVDYRAMAEVMAARSALIREMGLDREPTIADMRSFLARYAQGRSSDEVADKLGALLSAFCVHCGASTTYGPHEGDAEAIHARAMQDVLRRNIIDCDGFAYTAQELLAEVRDAEGQPRFDTYVVDTARIITSTLGDGFHALLTVRERSTGNLFVVNNDDTSARRYQVTGTTSQQLAIATYFALDEKGYSGDAPLRLRLSPERVFRNSAEEYGPGSYTLTASREDRQRFRER